MHEPYKIEVDAGGRWIEIGTDNNREYVCHRVKWTDEHLGHFAEILEACGWSGPKIDAVRLRNADTGEILSADQCFSERMRLEDAHRR